MVIVMVRVASSNMQQVRTKSNYKHSNATFKFNKLSSRMFCRSGFEFAKTQLSILNH